jgi:transposase-like protein
MSENKSYESTSRIESESVSVGGADVQGEAPSPEVKPRIRRKNLTTEYKLRILSETDRLGRDSGRIAALLRREGLYASHLSNWRRLRSAGAYTALSKTRGRKLEHDAKDLEIKRLGKELDKLRTWKKHAELIMDAQKKIALILGNPIQEETLPKLPSLDQDEVNS